MPNELQNSPKSIVEAVDALPERKRKLWKLAGTAHIAMSAVALTTGLLFGFTPFLMLASIPGMLALSWMVLLEYTRNAADSTSTQSAQHQSSLLKQSHANTEQPSPIPEQLEQEPLEARIRWIDDTPTAVQKERAARVEQILADAQEPLTVHEITTKLRWTDDAVVSGLYQLYDSHTIREEFPEDHKLQWRYELTYMTPLTKSTESPGAQENAVRAPREEQSQHSDIRPESPSSGSSTFPAYQPTEQHYER